MGKLREALKKTHRRLREHTEIITFEEAIWLFIGLGFGWLAAIGMYPMLLIIPVVLFIFYAWVRRHEKKFGKHNVFGEPMAKVKK